MGAVTHKNDSRAQVGVWASWPASPGFPGLGGKPRPAATWFVELLEGHWMQRAKGLGPEAPLVWLCALALTPLSMKWATL